MFHPDHIPTGWYDSPRSARAGLEAEKEEKPKQKRRSQAEMQAARLLENGNSARSSQ